MSCFPGAGQRALLAIWMLAGLIFAALSLALFVLAVLRWSHNALYAAGEAFFVGSVLLISGVIGARRSNTFATKRTPEGGLQSGQGEASVPALTQGPKSGIPFRSVGTA